MTLQARGVIAVSVVLGVAPVKSYVRIIRVEGVGCQGGFDGARLSDGRLVSEYSVRLVASFPFLDGLAKVGIQKVVLCICQAK